MLSEDHAIVEVGVEMPVRRPASLVLEVPRFGEEVFLGFDFLGEARLRFFVPGAWLRPGMAPRGDLVIPAHRLGVILRHASVRVIHHVQAELRHDMALYVRLLEPLESLDVALWYAFA